ncbi:hypothetical protein N7468_007526 [Penicillium chermesinum]|uniref:NAD(P)-binding domain-containing protein n=1 Tax=Penicillium chermesinum TaxID=63820 RepID=A0A9W9NUZ9_9EURO|nr:uncharacterized protein N7468_007526 [Penicillium chermesinum]KAJ5226301.1 hypothetical protein N7468_007526 [Penicillium chermesinum]KAJ6160516.1 hypothetical protein N7470_003912 [Penicillium chermesinum]
MATIHNVVIAGATGNVGAPILKALLDSKRFNITILTRNTSDTQLPDSVTVIRVDYSSVADLTAALTGRDAIVSALTSHDMNAQASLLDAAVAAGVKRFIPSEFSGNWENPKAITLPVYKTLHDFHKLIQQKARENPTMTYTAVRNGPFFDWALAHGFFLNLKGDTSRIFDGGNQPFTGTTLASVGQAVVGILTHPEETKNRAVFIKDVETSQNRLLDIAKKIAPGREWNTEDVNTADVAAYSREQFASGNIDQHAALGFFARAIFGEGYGGALDGRDNELLGVKVTTDAGVEAILKEVLSGSS